MSACGGVSVLELSFAVRTYVRTHVCVQTLTHTLLESENESLNPKPNLSNQSHRRTPAGLLKLMQTCMQI